MNRTIKPERIHTNQRLLPNSLVLDEYQIVTRDQCPNHNQKIQIALCEYFTDLVHNQNRTLFHVVTTYKPYHDTTGNESVVNLYFKNWYQTWLLPYLCTKNFHRNCKRQIQPITYSFIDEHEQIPVKDKFTRGTNDKSYAFDLYRYKFPLRLHHHSLVAVHLDTIEKMQGLIGTNTIVGSMYKIMTSDIKQCNPEDISRLVSYASKMYWKYPEYQVFIGTDTRIKIPSR